MSERFKPVKRCSLDGKVWWVVWDNKEKNYCTYYRLTGKHKLKRDCQAAIDDYERIYCGV